MNLSDSAVDDYLTANTGKALVVTTNNGVRIVGTVTRGAAWNNTSDLGYLVLIVDETVSPSVTDPTYTRRWIVDLGYVESLTPA